MGYENVCVIGAGITGLTVANQLDRAGLDVLLVEKNPYPGGHSIFYGCKAADSCAHCGVCLVRESVAQFRHNQRVESHFSSVPLALRSNGGEAYQIQIESNPNPIDWKLCNECGKCVEICPEEAVKQIPGWKYTIDSRCTGCGKCVGACPVQAIQLNRETTTTELSASAVVVATGFGPFDPKINRKWGYGAFPRIITGQDLELLFFQEKYLPCEAQSLAFIQCVGSRNTMEGEQHCSRVCCAYALRMANRLKREFPELRIDFHYMDIQYFGKNFEEFCGEVSGKVNFIQSNPITVRKDDQGRPVLRYESLPDLTCKETAYDVVVLSNGIRPTPDSGELADIFNLDLNPQRFLRPLDSPGSARTGVFPAGTCQGPMRIDECVEDASTVSNRVLHYLGVRI